MKKREDYGDCTGKCAICTINLWSSSADKPVIWPCNIEGCPYEHPSQQNRRASIFDTSQTGSGLAQIDF